MAIRIVRIGSPRTPGEGLRIGTVRRPPRGVPRTEFASRNFYDVWLPELAPSEELLKFTRQNNAGWEVFVKRYRTEMKQSHTARLLNLLAAFSQQMPFSLGCYCADESRCHRSILKILLQEYGAIIE